MKTFPDIAKRVPAGNAIVEEGAEASKDVCYQHLVDVIGMRATVATRAQFAMRGFSPNSTLLELVDGGAGIFDNLSYSPGLPGGPGTSMRRRLEVWVNEGGAVAGRNGHNVNLS
jgi:hypothetical protein